MYFSLMLGIFHSYAHEYKCQMLFSPRYIKGMGWPDGEACERAWAASRHIVNCTRVSGSRIRKQTLTEVFMSQGDTQRNKFGYTCHRSLVTMIKNIDKENHELKEYYEKNSVIVDEVLLRKQFGSMREFFLRPGEGVAHARDDICELLMAIEDMEMFAKARREVVNVC